MQQMMTCPNCGSQNAANQQFCVSCGAHLGTSQRPASHMPVVTGVVAPPPVIPSMVAPAPMVAQVIAPPIEQSKQVEVKPTWTLAWGLLWRIVLLELFFAGVIFLIYMVVRMALGYTSVF